MKNVLVVDDEETLLLIMVNRFEDYADQFNVFTARNGKEAVEVLESESIDFLVTDLKMPEMDGIELLALMSSKYSHIPAMAMSAFSTPEIERKLAQMGTLRVLDKPVNFDLLADAIIRGLDNKNEGGSINCVTVSSFLQLIKMEDKTCMLEVHREDNQRGFIYIRRGDLLDAECGDLTGEKAALEIIGWDSQQLFIKELPRDIKENKINKGLMSVVMEALRRKDEREVSAGGAEQSVVDDNSINFDSDEVQLVGDEPQQAVEESEVAFKLNESDLAKLDSSPEDDTSTFGFEIDEPEVDSDNAQSVDSAEEPQSKADEADANDTDKSAAAQENENIEFDPGFDEEEPEVAENADFGDSQESIFGDADVDFALDEAGLDEDGKPAKANTDTGDDSGLDFEFDELDDLESPSAKKKPSVEPLETAAPDDADPGTDDSLFDTGFDEIIAETIKTQPPSGRNPKSAKAEVAPEAGSQQPPDAKAPKAAADSKVHKTRQVGSIEKIFRSLNSEQQLNQVLGKVLKTLQKVVPFDLAVLMTRKADSPDHLQIEEIVVRGAVKSIQYNHIPYKGAEFDAVMKMGKSLTVDDTSRLKGPLERKMFCKHGLTSCLIIPLSINGKVAGVLTLGARKQKIFRRTRQYVEWVGNGIALAIERDRLALESRQRGLALNVTIQIIQTLIAMKFDISKVLSLVFELIRDQMNVEAGFVYLTDGKTLTLHDGFNADGKPIKQRKLAFEDAIAGQVVKRGAPILVNDMSRLPHPDTESSKLFDFQTRSVLSVPLWFDEKIEGVIEVRNKRQGDYKAEDELLMQAIGTAVAIALKSARCYKKKTGSDQRKKEVMASLQKLISKNVEQMAAA